MLQLPIVRRVDPSMLAQSFDHRTSRASDHRESRQGGLTQHGRTTARVVIDGAACLAVASPFAACSRCVDLCPTAAIALDERVITTSDERCVGCGRCAAACPTEAIGVPGFGSVAAGWVECARVAACDRLPGAAVVPCLGGLRSTDLLESEPVAIDRGWCADCPAGGVDAPWADAATDADAVRHWLGLEPVRVERRPLALRRALPLPEHLDARGAARRGLFRRAVAEAPAPAVEVAVRRLEPRATLHRAAMIAERAGRPAPAALLPSLTVSEACDANRICIAACPTSASSVVTDAAGTGLDFDAVRCTACGVCAAACPTGAITVEARGHGEAAGPFALTRDPGQTCPDCGQIFTSRDGAAVCTVCANERELAKLGFDLMRGPRHVDPSRNPTGHSTRSGH